MWGRVPGKNAVGWHRAPLRAWAMPAMAARVGSVRRKSGSMNTANGGAKLPRKFFLPNALMPFFPPTPASACESTVVGTRTTRTPRCAVAAA